jgi:2-keto-3-deoxy-L-fuconate dehydrogenase
MISFEGKTVFITGAGNGIGRATARIMGSLGARVGILDIDLDAARSVAAELGTPDLACAVRADVADPGQVRSAVAALAAALGPPAVLVNNAGVSPLGPIEAISRQQFLEVMSINVGGAINMVSAVLPHLRVQNAGRIVNVASWLGVRSRPMFGLYCATKAALISLTRTMALEFAHDGITVNAVLPGAIADTPMRREADEAARAAGMPIAAERAATIPLGRLGTPDDVAQIIAFACSHAARYTTGETISADGGLSAAAV